MSDMAQAIIPKSDQLNADDLIAGPRTIRIRDVAIRGGQEQPVSIFFDGDNEKPWKPCKSMSRVLVLAWGADAKKYAGRSLTLYREPTVKWAGMEVGGIRISHMEGLSEPMTMVLTATKGSRKPYTVRPMETPATTVSAETAQLVKEYGECSTAEHLAELEALRKKNWAVLSGADKKALKAASDAASERVKSADGWSAEK